MKKWKKATWLLVLHAKSGHAKVFSPVASLSFIKLWKVGETCCTAGRTFASAFPLRLWWICYASRTPYAIDDGLLHLRDLLYSYQPDTSDSCCCQEIQSEPLFYIFSKVLSIRSKWTIDIQTWHWMLQWTNHNDPSACSCTQ